jgi:hypothetical protein
MVYFGNASLLAFAAIACAATHASPAWWKQSPKEKSSDDYSVRGNCTRNPLGGSFQLIKPLSQDKIETDFGKFAVNADGAEW